MNRTLNYYNENSKAFIDSTRNVDFSIIQNKFLKCLPQGAKILDFGCGSGRDTKYFLDRGYLVDAIDGSVELCRLASEYTGITVRNMLFQELNKKEKYDGIWACASILHLNKQEIQAVLRKMLAALKADGIIYTSFKYGDYEGMRNERFFTDFTEETFCRFIENVKGLKVKCQWITGDARSDRSDEKWLNLILIRG